MRLENGIETLELGVTAWRSIINDNFSKLFTAQEVKAEIAKFSGASNLDFSCRSLSVGGQISLSQTQSNTSNLDLGSLGDPDGFVRIKLGNGKFAKVPYWEE